MTADKKKRLEKTVADIRQRFGLRAIGRSDGGTVAGISTGFPELDRALGGVGLPRGRLSEIIGVPTSGMATLALNLIVQAQKENTGSMAAYLDLEKTFDPHDAARCGVDLARLLLVRPDSTRQALAMLPDFAANSGFDVVVVDAPVRWLAAAETADLMATTLGRIIAPLSRSGNTLVFLTGLPPQSEWPLPAYPAYTGLPHYASVRLLIQRAQWLYRAHDVAGYEAQVLVVKNRLAAEGQRVVIGVAGPMK